VRIIWWIVAALAALILIAFAIANRGAVEVSFAPLPFALAIPLFAAVLGALAVGLLAGAAAKSLVGTPSRRLARARRQRIEVLEREVAALRADAERRRAAGATPATVSGVASARGLDAA
jgi:uncharacterized integral membrane protein